MARQLSKVGIEPRQSDFEMVALGPFFPEQSSVEAHRKHRDIVAALEAKTAAHLTALGYAVVGSHGSRMPLDQALWEEAERRLRADFPQSPRIDVPVSENPEHLAFLVGSILVPEFREQVTFYRDAVVNKLAPAFGKIEDESNAYAEKLFEGCTHTDDPGSAADWAMDHAACHHMSLVGAKCAVLSLAAAGLYHMFEQQMTAVLKAVGEEVPRPGRLCTDGPRCLARHGYAVKQAPDLSTIAEEMRLVANAVKHGDGCSARDLFTVRPALFRERWSGGEDIATPLSESMRLPLAGEGLVIDLSDFERYAETLLSFWNGWPYSPDSHMETGS